MARLIAGCMTGTSCDAVDVALVHIEGRGLAMRAEVVDAADAELGELGGRLRAIAAQAQTTARECCELADELADRHRVLVAGLRPRPDLVVVHGQTVHHAPPHSWQMINLARLAHGLAVPVVGDLRAADLALGGQGAPITPLADWILLRAEWPRAVINLGGFANHTFLPADGDGPGGIDGGDLCVCNQLLDGLARRLLHRGYDDGGAFAVAGKPRDEQVGRWRERLGTQADAGRSLGTGDEPVIGAPISEGRPGDHLAAACRAIALTVAAVCDERCADAVLAGGGVANRRLVAELEDAFAAPVYPSDDFGVPAALREAMAMAVLGALSQDRVPITLPRVTGVDAAPVAGTWVAP